MGGMPTNVEGEVLRNNTDGRPRPVRRRRGRLRVRARRQPPRHQLAARHQRLRAPGRHRRRGVRRERRPFVELPDNPAALVVEHGRDACATRDGRRAGAPILRRGCRRRWTATSQVFRTEASLKQALGDIDELKERYPNVVVQDKGKRFNTDLLEAVELGFLLDLAEVLGGVRAGPQGVPRRSLPRGLPDPRRRQLHAPHHGLPRASTTTAASTIRLDYKPVDRRPATSRWSASTDDRH